MNPVERVVGAILRKDDRVLLCLRSRKRKYYPGVWDVPGGHIDPHESPEAALVRELEEELGVSAQVARGAPWKLFQAEGLEFSLFMIDQWAGEIRNCAPHEHEEVRWVSLDELPQLQLAHPLYRKVLAEALGSS